MNVYVVNNNLDGRVYVGKTTRPLSERWREHRKDVSRKGPLSPLHRAILKHGSKNFSISTVADAENLEELAQLELLWILALRSFDPALGYNRVARGIKQPYTGALISIGKKSEWVKRKSEGREKTGPRPDHSKWMIQYHANRHTAKAAA